MADGATEQAPGHAVGSLALASTSRRRAVIVAECRRCRPQVHGPAYSGQSGGRGGRGGPECLSGCLPCLGRLSAYSGASTRPVSGVRCDRPVSAAATTTVGCPMSGVDVRCPASVSARSGVRVRCVCTGDFVERVVRGQPTVRGARAGRPAVSANGSTTCLSQRGFESGTVWRRIGQGSMQVGGGDYAPWSPCEAWGRVAWSSESLPSWTASCSRGRSAAATCSERRPLEACGALASSVGGWR